MAHLAVGRCLSRGHDKPLPLQPHHSQAEVAVRVDSAKEGGVERNIWSQVYDSAAGVILTLVSVLGLIPCTASMHRFTWAEAQGPTALRGL